MQYKQLQGVTSWTCPPCKNFDKSDDVSTSKIINTEGEREKDVVANDYDGLLEIQKFVSAVTELLEGKTAA